MAMEIELRVVQVEPEAIAKKLAVWAELRQGRKDKQLRHIKKLKK